MSEQSAPESLSISYAERVVVWAPGGRTAELITETLERADLHAVRCEDIDVFCRLVREGSGAAILTEEVFLDERHADRVADLLAAQPAWSNLPVKVFVSDEYRIAPRYERFKQLNLRRSVTVLDRPIRPAVLISIVQAALQHRQRQYELRDAIKTLRATASTLEDQVDAQTGQLRRLAVRLTRAEQAERRRISQLLHDDLQQLLHGIGLKLGVAEKKADAGSETLQDDLAEAHEWVEEAFTMTRQLTSDLSPPVLGGSDLTSVMQWLRFHMEELHELDVTVETEGAHRVADEELRELIFQIVRELLFNVKKHAGTDRATVRLTEEIGHLVVHVIDEGGGFDVDEATARKKQEGGFGLFSAAERLDLMGGRLEIQSIPGEGTHVEVHAPTGDEHVTGEERSMDSEQVPTGDVLRTVSSARGAGRSAPASGLSVATEPFLTRVLTVDNHPVLREMLTALLGHERDMTICGEARTGDEALRAMSDAAPDVAPDLALVDIALPDMSGVDLVRELRARHPSVDCVVLSVHGAARWVDDALEAGAQGYILKGDAAAIPEAIRHVRQGAIYVSEALHYSVSD